MVKRPLIWILAVYAAGCLCRFYGGAFRLSFVFLLVLFFFLFLLFLFFPKTWTQYRFFCLLPLLLYAGACSTQRQLSLAAADSYFEDRAGAKIWGTVDRKEAKGDKVTVCLKQAKVQLSPGTEEILCGGVLLTLEGTAPGIGNGIYAEGTLYKLRKPTNFGQFDEKMYYLSKGIAYRASADHCLVIGGRTEPLPEWLASFRGRLASVCDRLLEEKEAGVIKAMLLGDKSSLSEDMKSLFQKGGIAHILTVSGMHVSFIGMACCSLMLGAGLSLCFASLSAGAVTILYGVMTGFGPAAQRAVIMFALFLGARLIGRTYDMLSAACLSAVMILWKEPLQLFQSGFLLSFGAVAGIACIYPVLKEGFRGKGRLSDMAALNAGIQLAMLPVLLFFYYEIPVYGFFLNFLVIPSASLLFSLAFCGIAAGSLFLPAGRLMMGGVGVILRLIETLCRLSQRLPGHSLIAGRPSSYKLFLYYVLLSAALLGFTLSRKKGKRIFFFMLLPAAVSVLLVALPRHSLRTTFLDVGQGDGIVMEAPDGSVFLVDGGSLDVKEAGKYRITPYLKARGVRRVDYALVTHGDMDHISGLLELLEEGEIPVRYLVLPRGAPVDGNYNKLIEAAGDKTGVLYMERGDRIRAGGVVIRCLHPFSGFTGASRNAYSLVLSVEWGAYSMLLTGDLEAQEETWIDGETLKGYDVLKVAHHGSAYSTTGRFLAGIRPAVSIISCGRNNSFGHPHPELLQRLRACHSRLYLTEEGGAVTVTAGRGQIRTTYFLPAEEEEKEKRGILKNRCNDSGTDTNNK